ncbi:hypothetical protein D6825_02950 [Candidatus Woesearchaeota archaeon]|nr:MAG: hypothetical protein D6825_02950 [Candidatus Woesearchaeota archaeon]
MADGKLRELELRWKQSSLLIDHLAYMVERLKSKPSKQNKLLVNALSEHHNRRRDSALDSLERALSLKFTKTCEEVYTTLIPESKGFYIEDASKRGIWRFHNSRFQNETCIEELTKEPVREDYVSQEEIIPELAICNQSLPSAPRLANIIIQLYKNRKSPLRTQRERIESIRKNLGKHKWILTGTAIIFGQNPPDTIIYEWNEQRENTEEDKAVHSSNLVGPNSWLSESEHSETVYALIKADPEKFFKAHCWLSEKKDIFLFRTNSRPQQTEKKTVFIGKGMLGGYELEIEDAGIAYGWRKSKKA